MGSRYGLLFCPEDLAYERGGCVGQCLRVFNVLKEELSVWLKDG
jgi:hypothetical protein